MPQPFNNAVMTNAGARLLTRAQAGEIKIEFTRIATGNGSYTAVEKTLDALQKRTSLKSLKNSYPISDIDIFSDYSVKVTALITNQDSVTGQTLVNEGYYINEMGLYAKVKDGAASTEVLYSITTTAGDNGDFMPPYNGYNPAQITQEYYATVSNSAEVTVQGGVGAPALADDMQKVEKKLENYLVLRILGTYDATVRYVGFVSLPLPSSGGRSEATFLVSGVGNIASPSCGTYLVQCGTRDHSSMAVTELTPPGSDGDISFGYWQAGDRVIFGMKRGPYNYHTNITMVSEDVNGEGFEKYEIAELYNSAETPAGWTAAGKRKFLAADGNAVSSTKLNTKRNIDGVNFDGTASVSRFGVCSTGASVRAKIVSINGFSKTAGAAVFVQFKNGNTAENPTLNVQGTGACPICYAGSPVPPRSIVENSVLQMVLDAGNKWNIMGDFGLEVLKVQMEDLKKTVSLFCGEKLPNSEMNTVQGKFWASNGPDAVYKQNTSEPYAKCAEIDAEEGTAYKVVTYFTASYLALDERGIIHPVMTATEGYYGDIIYDAASDGKNVILVAAASRRQKILINSFGVDAEIEIYKINA